MQKKIKKIENQFIYYYFYDSNQLSLITVYEKKRFLKKYYGSYEFLYQDSTLVSQTSRVEDLGITESVKYFYDHLKRLIKKEYYNNQGQLRYTLDFFYQDTDSPLPYSLKVLRMGEFQFFETEKSSVIQRNLESFGKDFDGSFLLLESIEEEKNHD
ncbi:MAG TPA: hypothetical protein DHW82_00190 [Spirochaetia bacterium]|nr:MAG: hypothetical protein A2Y41_11065 [Spirochaetes bacterium GWB1_36_13]HCL55420.1 hypothetical protein [Spirochaetia bacterium]